MLPDFFHVKWFTDWDIPMLALDEMITGHFLFWLGVTLAGLLLSAIFNEPLQRLHIVQRLHRFLDKGKPYATIILRVGLGLTLIMQLFSGTYLAPELANGDLWVKIALVIALIGLLHRKLLPISGVALTVLYIQAIREFGLFHALDYMFYVGMIYYLLVVQTRWKATVLPVLYLFTGLSLAWVAIEKIALPRLAQDIMISYHVPSFGFSIEDFVLISAFIELGLAWTFIVGILNRFISLIVTGVFILTTTVFGFTEIMGHTILHTLLILFLIEGEGTFKTPFQFHRSPILRYLFVLVNFCILLFGIMWLYHALGA